MIKIIKIMMPLFLLAPVYSWAALEPMAETELAATYGQALYEVLDQKIEQPTGDPLRMLRLTMGARIEINANVAELSLGRYWRPEGTNCTGGSGGDKVCYNNITPVDYNDNINWACTAKPCGAVGIDAKNFKSSALTHNTSGVSFFDYAGGFQPDGGIDIKLRDVTMGQIVNGQLLPFVQENPYFEFAFSGDKLVGFRMGAEETFGYQGNIIDVISGFIRPTITAQAKLWGTIGLGTITLEASLGGVRTVGWLDEKTIDLRSVTGAAGLLVTDPKSLVGESPEAQLFPVQSNYLDHTRGFFISVGTRSIQWSPVQGFSADVTSPGFWLNMGGDGSLIATTQNGDHPVNYFPGHPSYNQYKNNANYGGNLPQWSQTYQ